MEPAYDTHSFYLWHVKPIRVIVVEDEAIAALDLTRRLRGLGYEVAGRAARGQQAIELAGQARPDLVLMDIHLQGDMDGIAAARRIRDQFRIPVVFLTAYSEETTLSRAKLAEPFGYVLKPFEDRELRLSIEIALYKHQAEEEIHRLSRLYATLSQVNQVLVRAGSREDIWRETCRVVVEQGGFRLAWLGWLEHPSQNLVPVAQAGEERGYLSRIRACALEGGEGCGLAAAAVRAGRSCVSNDLERDPRLAGWQPAAAEAGLRAAAAFPIRLQNEVHGALSVYGADDDLFGRKEIELMEGLAADVSFALDKLESEARFRRTQDLLREHDRRMAAIIESTAAGYFALDAEGCYRSVNAAWLKMHGYTSPDEVLGRHFSLTHPEADVAAGRQVVAAVLGGQTIQAGELSRRCRDGAIAYHSYSASPVWQEGRIVGLEGFLIDSTECKQAQAQIQAQAALLEVAQDAILEFDLAGRIRFWNRGAERLYGWKAVEVLHQPITDLLFQQPALQFEESRRQVLEKGEWSGELRQTACPQREVIVRSRWTLVLDRQGQPQSVLAVGTDITEQKKLEAQYLRAQRVETIGTLSSGLAHDLNNVLAPILMATHYLETLCRDDDSRRMLRTMETSAKRGAGIIKQLLTFGRGLTGDRGLLQPRHLLQEMAKIAAETFPKNVRVEVQSSHLAWPVTGDATQLHQVLLNLCVNARDAMPEGGTLTLQLENVRLDETFAGLIPEAKPGPYVVLTVSDTGTGIAPEHLNRVFDPFFTTKAPGSGTGLGLATVLNIAKGHGGFVQVSSAPGQGTRFQVYLPATESATAPVPSEIVEAPPQGQGEMILVVDDELAVRQVAKQTLESNGYRVLVANDGTEAVAVYAQHRSEIKVVLLDLLMPSMDGATTLPILRGINPQVRVVLCSGLLNLAASSPLNAPKAQAILQKPFTGPQLLRTIREVVLAA